MNAEDPLVPVFIPALVVLLLNRDKAKGTALTKSEVEAIRDKSSAIMLPRSQADKLAESRGYSDIDPERAWEEWSVIRPTFYPPAGPPPSP